MSTRATGDLVDLVIFDHDGVLVDSEIIAMALIARLLTEAGVPTTVDEAIATYLGGSLDVVMDVIEASGTRLDRTAFDRDFHDALLDGFQRGLLPVPGIRDLLVALRDRGLPTAIASSGSSQRVALGILVTGLAEFFAPTAITTRDDVDRGKPFPDLFVLAARRAGVDPHRCLVIEDSPAGVEAGHRAGMRVVGLSFRTPPERLSAADWVVTDAGEILDILPTP